MIYRLLPVVLLAFGVQTLSAQRLPLELEIGYLSTTLDGQSPTVMVYLFTETFDAIDATENQVSRFASAGREIREAVMIALTDSIKDYAPPRLITRQHLKQTLGVLKKDHPDAHQELLQRIYDIRKNARDSLLPHQLDKLIAEALRMERIRALRYEEVADRVGVSDVDRVDFAVGIQDVIAEYRNSIRGRLPAWAKDKDLVYKLGSKGTGLSFGPTEAQLHRANERAKSRIMEIVEEVLDDRQIETITQLLEQPSKFGPD